MIGPLLQLTDVTKSFGAVRALRGVSFDLQAGAPSQPGGLQDISRGLSNSDTPGTPSKTNRTPEGCQNRPPIPCRRLTTANLWHPSGVREICLSGYRGCRRCAPRPPANVWQPSGLRLETPLRAALIFGAWSLVFDVWLMGFRVSFSVMRPLTVSTFASAPSTSAASCRARLCARVSAVRRPRSC